MMIILMYMVCTFFILGLTELVLLLFLMELLSWVFTLFLKKMEVLKYLMVQTIFLLSGLMSILWSMSLFLLIMVLKLGVPPFHLWFLNLASTLNKYSFLFMTTLHKMIPLFCVTKFLWLMESYFLILITLVSGVLIMESSEMFNVLMFSSMIHSSWMMMSGLISFKIILFYFFLYSVIVLMFIACLKTSSLWFSSSEQTSNSSLLWLILSGFPPFSLFWLKVILISQLVFKMMSYSVIMTMTSVFSLFIYYRIFHLVTSPSFLSKEQTTLSPIITTMGIQ